MRDRGQMLRDALERRGWGDWEYVTEEAEEWRLRFRHRGQPCYVVVANTPRTPGSRIDAVAREVIRARQRLILEFRAEGT